MPKPANTRAVGCFALSATEQGVLITCPQWPGLALGPLQAALTLDGVRQVAPWRRRGQGLCARFPGAMLTLEPAPEAGGGMQVACRLAYQGREAAILNRVELLTLAEGARAGFGEGEEAARIYETHGGYFSYVRDIGEPARSMAVSGEPAAMAQDAPRQGTSLSVWELYQPAAGQALLVGFDTFARWLGTVHTGYQPGQGMTAWTAGFDGGDLPLEPGEELALESMVWMVEADPWRLLERWGEHVQRRHHLQPLAASPVSWCSWYPYRLTVSEQALLANAQAAAARLRPLGLSIMEVDLGWERGWLPSEYRENDQFPHGLRWLAARLGELGLELGVWNAPYSVSEHQALPKEHPEWLIPGEDGRPAVEGTWFWEPHGKVHVLDLTHPGAQAWLAGNIRSLGERGARYLKCDFISSVHSASLRRRHDARIVGGGGTEAGRLGARIISQALAEVQPQALVLNCNGMEVPGLGLFGLLYACYDTGNTGFVGWRHLREVYTTVACHLYKQGRWGIIQPSCLCVGLPGTLEEARVRATATFLCGGEVNISDDLTSLPEDRWQVLLSVLPPTSRPARPVDLFEADYPAVWHLALAADWDQWHLVGLFNFELPCGRYDYQAPERRQFRVPLQRLGLEPGQAYWAYEFWSGRFLGEVREALESAFFGPAVQLVALRRARPHPWVVGTSFHQSVGGELAGVGWEQEAGRLCGELRRPAGEQGRIAIFAPGGGQPRATVAGRPARMRMGAGGCWEVPVVAAAAVTPWAVQF